MGLIQKRWIPAGRHGVAQIQIRQHVKSRLLNNRRCADHQIRAAVAQPSDERRPEMVVPPGHLHMHQPAVLQHSKLVQQ